MKFLNTTQSISILLFGILLLLPGILQAQILLPIRADNRHSIQNLHITEIGQFGKVRKERVNIPSHLHTGIDIMRPVNNFNGEPIYPIAEGIVISKRTDGPYAQLIIEHYANNLKFWTVYEHIAGITVHAGDRVSTNQKIARFMNKEELNRYGWQFNHFHLEILKIKPKLLKTDPKNPERHYQSYTLVCYTPADLEKYFYDPIRFFKTNGVN